MKSLSKRVSRFLGMLLAVVLIVGMLPASALAEVRASDAVTGKTFTQTNTLTDGQYVLVSTGKALDQTVAETYVYNSSGTYTYDGFDGKSVTVSNGKITSTVTEDMVWEVKAVSGGYTIESTVSDGSYLSGSYVTSSSTHGVLELSEDACVWTFADSKFGTGGKYISNDDSQYQNRFDFFTMRSNGSAFTLFKVEDASGSGDGSGSGEGTVPDDPADTPDTDGKIVIVSNGRAMTTDAGESYSNNGNGSQRYNYTGLAGKVYTEGMSLTANMLWEVEDAGNGYLYIKNGNQYLNGSYVSNSSGGSDGSLSLGAKSDKWIWEGDTLKSYNADKYLTYGNTSQSGSNVNTFSVRSANNATDIEFIEVETDGDHRHADADGKWESNATQHYRTCSCGETFDAASHNFRNGACTVCNAADPDYVAPSGPATYVAFTSDVHNQSTTATGGSAARLNNWINNVSGVIDSAFATMAFCGDNGSAYQNGDSFWNLVQVVMDVVSNNNKVAGDGVFINGNHEFQNGSQSSSNTNATAKKIKNIGDVVTGDDYLIYVFGAASGSQGFNTTDITALGNWLNSTPAGKPIFVISHFPLHADSGRDSTNKAQVVSTLNTYADKHEIYFLWGHNHTNADSKYDEVITGTLENKAIGFTYMAAGCMSDSEYSNGSASVKGKGLVAKIQDGTVTSLTYYAENASVVYSYAPGQSGTPGTGPDDPADTPSTGDTVAIISSGYVLTTAEGEPYTNTGSSNSQLYNYTGLAGKVYTEGMSYTNDMLWEVEDAGDGYFYLKNGNQYLNGSYVSNSSGGYDGSLSLGAKSDKWIWEGDTLKSYNASQTSTGDKYLTYGNATQSGSNVNTFSVRSASNASSVTFVEVESDSDGDHRHADVDGKWESNATQHYRTCSCGETFDAANHSGGTATCSEKAECATCGAEYGDLNVSNHDGDTEVRGAVAATCGEAGYTGDTYCLDCDAKIGTGTAIPATGNHDFEDGICSVCGAEDPDYGIITDLTVDVAKATFTGSAQQPVLTIVADGVTLVEGTDYVIASQAQTNAGTYEFTVEGTGEYEGEITGEWTIAPAGIASVEGLELTDKFVTTGNPIKPVLSLSFNGTALVMGTDYAVAYTNNVNPGLATVTVTGIGNFAGTADVSFEILPKGAWVNDPSGWKYRNPDGTYSADCWQEIDGERYYFGSDGYMQTGWLKDAGEWYYLKASGAMAYAEWEEVSDYWYHFADDGVMQTGWLKDGDSWYWLKSGGKMAYAEWEEVSGSWYHFAASGVMQTGWLKDAGEWYYLKASGAMACSEWEEVDDAWYYFNAPGVMQSSKWIGNYYVLANGKMATNQWVGQYYVGADGKWIPGYKG